MQRLDFACKRRDFDREAEDLLARRDAMARGGGASGQEVKKIVLLSTADTDSIWFHIPREFGYPNPDL